MSEIKDLIKLPVKGEGLRIWDADGDILLRWAEFAPIDRNIEVTEYVADAINNYERLEKENAELQRRIKHASFHLSLDTSNRLHKDILDILEGAEMTIK